MKEDVRKRELVRRVETSVSEKRVEKFSPAFKPDVRARAPAPSREPEAPPTETHYYVTIGRKEEHPLGDALTKAEKFVKKKPYLSSTVAASFVALCNFGLPAGLALLFVTQGLGVPVKSKFDRALIAIGAFGLALGHPEVAVLCLGTKLVVSAFNRGKSAEKRA